MCLVARDMPERSGQAEKCDRVRALNVDAKEVMRDGSRKQDGVLRGGETGYCVVNQIDTNALIVRKTAPKRRSEWFNPAGHRRNGSLHREWSR